MTNFVVSRKNDDENQQPLSEIFKDVEGVRIISAAVPYMATVAVEDSAINGVRDIIKKQDLSLMPSRGVDLL